MRSHHVLIIFDKMQAEGRDWDFVSYEQRASSLRDGDNVAQISALAMKFVVHTRLVTSVRPSPFSHRGVVWVPARPLLGAINKKACATAQVTRAM